MLGQLVDRLADDEELDGRFVIESVDLQENLKAWAKDVDADKQSRKQPWLDRVSRLMEEKGTFQEIVVWRHEAVPEEGDVYVKGMEEWIAFAEAVSLP